MKKPDKLSTAAVASATAVANENLSALRDHADENFTWISKEDLAASGLISNETRCKASPYGVASTKEQIKLYPDKWLEGELDGAGEAYTTAYGLATVDANGNGCVEPSLCTGESFSRMPGWLNRIYDSSQSHLEGLCVVCGD